MRWAAGMALAAVLAVSACGSSNQAVRGATRAFTASGLLAGTARPLLSPAGAGKPVAVVATGPLNLLPNVPGAMVMAIIRNNTRHAIAPPDVTGVAISPAGQVFGGGDSQGDGTPTVIGPGQLALTQVDFDSGNIPPKSKVRLKAALSDYGPSPSDLKVDRVGPAPGSSPGNVILTGEATNTTSAPLARVGPDVFCFTTAGQFQGTEVVQSTGLATVRPGASTTFTINLEGPCSTYLVGVH